MSNLLTNFWQFLTSNPLNEQRIQQLEEPEIEPPLQPATNSSLLVGEKAIDPSFNILSTLSNWNWACGTAKIDYVKFKQLCNNFYLDESISLYIDSLCRGNSPVAKTYLDHLTACDTEIEIELELIGDNSEARIEEAKALLERELPKFYPNCNDLRDVSRFRMGYLLRYGAFISQKWYVNNELKELIVIPPYSIRWMKGFNQFLPYQLINNEEIPLSQTNLIYAPLFPIDNAFGSFFIPPLLAGIQNIPSLDMFNESLQKIANMTGFHKFMKISANDEAIKNIIESNNVQVQEAGKGIIEFITNTIKSIQEGIYNTFKLAVLPVQWGTKIEEGSTYEPPANLAILKELITSDIIMGLKTYPAISGWVTGENQTTLSDTQKKVWKNFIETIQSKDSSVAEKDAIATLAQYGYAVKKIKITHEMPSLETDLQKEQTKTQELNNEKLELEVDKLKNDNINLQSTPNPAINDENSTQAETSQTGTSQVPQ